MKTRANACSLAFLFFDVFMMSDNLSIFKGDYEVVE